MHYLALATDYDGTLATEGRVEKMTIQALQRFRESGRRLVLVTGRELDDLIEVFPEIGLFDAVVAENGALLYLPGAKEKIILGSKPNKHLVEALKKRKVTPLFVGKSIVATREPYERDVIEVIRELGLELQIIFNKGAVMILPSGVSKESGLRAALQVLGISPLNVIGVGDAENDHALLHCSGLAVAVKNSLSSLKENADWVTHEEEGAGVVELIGRILQDDLVQLSTQVKRHQILLGRNSEGEKIRFSPFGASLLIAGPSGSGKTRVAASILERVAKKGYQFCVIDPEGDYENFPNTVRLGDTKQIPAYDEIIQLLEHFENPVINLLGLSLSDRPAYFSGLLLKIQELKNRRGHPHWLVVDEAHHLFPNRSKPVGITFPSDFMGLTQITVHPDEINLESLSRVNLILAVGKDPDLTIQRFCQATDIDLPKIPKLGRKQIEAIFWSRIHPKNKPEKIRVEPGSVEHERHQRKYAQGDLEEDSFYFRGPEGKLNIRAQNLVLFTQIGLGVDADTWMFHLKKHDFSNWIRKAVQDTQLAKKIERIEKKDLSIEESRKAVIEAIEKAYTAAV
jgi:HAD superfamily hydrolase (TIGR01484 family)